ncbi:crotonase/enoyl-CoA hydratase family protein [Aromatoleum aromaticum]|uniref:Enoyl-CoA hydratase n=1 Tax=Aromatoleum aromaticum (strain DSM 19018 / LMG 30748 / EbN1) TaxID=76114 RepID=Q5P040_AROAE|nr:crotonase/enoyl-CoA hydratase family protein [Aromatoleum aromaticum]NMG54862.1 crotonase/enoyl-CoA hydratase family protein [Aromatoleum aromaticum]CAI09324.1 Enoyl-CoA hydratase [Aromatoleum aromaticum EbN1]
MTEDYVTYRLEGAIALVGLNRPEKRNAINETVISQLRDAVLRAHEEADVGVLHAHGPNFSAGLDLAEALARATGQPPRKRRRHSWHEVFDLVARGPIPWVAALQGAVVGGGLELATAAHVRVCDESAFFGLPEGQRGIFVGGGGTVRIQRVVGYSAMTDMMLTGRLLDAAEAERANLVRYVVPAGQALDKAMELAAKVASNTPDTNWKIVNVLPRVNDLSHDDGLFMEYLTLSMPRPPEAAQRLRDFLEARATPLVPSSHQSGEAS